MAYQLPTPESRAPSIGMIISQYKSENCIDIKLIWSDNTEYMSSSTNDVLKMIFSGVSLIQPSNLQKFPCSYFEIAEPKWTVFSCIYPDPQNDGMLYSTAFVFNLGAISMSSSYYELIYDDLVTLSIYISYLLKNDKTIQEAESEAIRIRASLERLLSSKVSEIPPLPNPLPSDSHQFLSQLLCSHLSTQMTTVIEAPTLNEAQPYLSFLAHFTLPYQLQMSSLSISDTPLPGLFIQCVRPQKDFPLVTLLQFPRSWTWANITTQTIYQSQDVEAQRSSRSYLRSHILQTFDIDREKRKSNLLNKCRPMKYAGQPSTWAISTVGLLESLNSSIANMICEQKMNELLNKAVSLITISDSIMENLSQMFLQPEHHAKIRSMIDISDEEELKIVVSVAGLFDPKIYYVVYTGSKQVLRKLVNTV